MARVRVCPEDGHENPADELFCRQCGVSLVNVVEVERAAEPVGVVENGADGDPGLGRYKICPNGHRNSPAAVDCVACGLDILEEEVVSESDLRVRKAAASERAASSMSGAGITDRDGVYRLAFPWGEVSVSERLPVGRDEDYSPLAGSLATYLEVSNRHAEFVVSGERLMLADVGSKNGTFVNSRRLAVDESCLLRDGDEIRFSRYVVVSVQIEGDQ